MGIRTYNLHISLIRCCLLRLIFLFTLLVPPSLFAHVKNQNHDGWSSCGSFVYTRPDKRPAAESSANNVYQRCLSNIGSTDPYCIKGHIVKACKTYDDGYQIYAQWLPESGDPCPDDIYGNGSEWDQDAQYCDTPDGCPDGYELQLVGPNSGKHVCAENQTDPNDPEDTPPENWEDQCRDAGGSPGYINDQPVCVQHSDDGDDSNDDPPCQSGYSTYDSNGNRQCLNDPDDPDCPSGNYISNRSGEYQCLGSESDDNPNSNNTSSSTDNSNPNSNCPSGNYKKTDSGDFECDHTTGNSFNGGEAQESEEGEGTGSAASDCKKTPTCTGDDIQCAILMQTFYARCGGHVANESDCNNPLICSADPVQCAAIQQRRDHYCKMYGSGDLTADDAPQSVDDLDNQEIDVSSVVDDVVNANPYFDGDCPADKTVNIMGSDITFPMTFLCDFATQIRPLILFIAYFTAFMIIFRRGLS